jgi:hypothetical protein
MIPALISSARLIGQPIFGVLLTSFNTAGQHLGCDIEIVVTKFKFWWKI